MTIWYLIGSLLAYVPAIVGSVLVYRGHRTLGMIVGLLGSVAILMAAIFAAGQI